MGRSRVQRRRKVLTWLFAIVLSPLVLVSRSVWDDSGITGEVLFMTGLVLISAAVTGRAWCSLYLCGYKTRTLVVAGPYSMCRNPLYFFSLLGGLGVGLATETMTVALIILVVFGVYYPAVIRAEERRLQEVHGDEYERYLRATPRFWPTFSHLCEPREYIVRPELFRRGVLDAMGFVWMAGAVKLVEALQEHYVLPVLFRLY